MKLINCYIENFGGLQNFSLDFSDGITVINEPNGFGKTTLATFIKTMLYGFPKTTRAKENDRKKYTPWQSGTFGGNLTFEYRGEKYRVERTFGATPKSDTFTLYKLDPLTKSNDFSDQLGVEIFGLDADSFERSTYLPQMSDNSSFDTVNIQAKLGNLVEDTNDINNFDKAVELLKKTRKVFKHYSGDGGIVNDAQRKIAELEFRARELKSQRLLLENKVQDARRLEEETENIELRVKQLREELSLAFGAAVRKELDTQHTALTQEKKRIDEQLSVYAARCENTPCEEDFKAYRDKLEGVTADRAQLNSILDQIQNNNITETVPTAEELKENSEKLSQIDALRRENTLSVSDPQPKKKNKPTTLCAVLGAVFVALAVVMFVMSKYAVGAAALTVGAVALIGAVYFGIKDMVSSRLPSADSFSFKETEIKIQKLEAEVRSFTTDYGADDENLFNAVNELNKRYEDSLRFKKASQMADDLEQRISSAEQSVNEFLQKFTTSQDGSLAERLTALQLQTHQDNVAYNDLLNRKKISEAKLAEFLEKNKDALALPVPEQAADTELLKKQEAELMSELNSKNLALSDLKTQIRYLQNETDTLPEIEDEIERLISTKKEAVAKTQLLDKTVELLTTAKESLSSSYLGGVKERFLYYMSQLSQETEKTAFVNQKLEVTIERHGIARDMANFSAGYTDIVMLCMRFALVDALFEDTKPFIILDDPFINLDDSNTVKALDLLKRLGQDRQIIYLVCNSSRNI